MRAKLLVLVTAAMFMLGVVVDPSSASIPTELPYGSTGYVYDNSDTFVTSATSARDSAAPPRAAASIRSNSTVGVHLRHSSDPVAPRGVDANVVVGRGGSSQTFVDDAGRISTVRYGGEIRVAPGTYTAGVVNSRAYSGHAFDQMQAREIVPSVVDDTIATGVSAPSRGGTSVVYGAGNDVSVVVNSQGRVVTVSYGDLRP